jgi:hypothetical protein
LAAARSEARPAGVQAGWWASCRPASPIASGRHPAQRRQLAHPGIGGGHVGAAGQPGQQPGRLTRRQDVQADHGGVLQRGQPPPAGDQHQAARAARQQRPDLLVPGRIIQHQQDLLPRDAVAPPRRPRIGSRRDLGRGRPGGQQQARQGIGRSDRLLSRGMGVQRQEELPVREPAREPVRRVHREGGLADPGHPVDGVDLHHHHHPAVGRPGAGQCPHQPRELGLAAGKGGNIPRQSRVATAASTPGVTPRRAVSTSAAWALPRAAATNRVRACSGRPNASASKTAVSL